ncbi:GGDEF domain-containing protein [Halobacillus fulvus]|nr:GGDEF domain-containing protein [Halobacillus fulvus]
MDYFVQFQLNVFALVILAVLYMIMLARAKVESYGKKILKAIMIATAIAIVVEPLTWIFDKKLFPGAYFLEYSTNFVLFLMGPILGGLMLSYVDYHFFKDPSRVQKKMFYQHMSLVTFFILIINLFYPIYFQVTPVTNNYSSGDFKDVHYLVLAGLYIYMFIFVIKNRKKVHSYVSGMFIIFFALPIFGMVIQMFDSKLYFSWTAIVLGILVAYTFLESTTTEQDFLTKLYNRQSYEVYLRHLIEIQRPFGVILIDLNYFKEINDEYGHHKGDEVLIEFGQILQKVFQKEALTARLGGDEFIVVVEKAKKTPDQYAHQIQKALHANRDPIVRNLTFSYGYESYTTGRSMDDLYTTVDEKMYQAKRESRLV